MTRSWPLILAGGLLLADLAPIRAQNAAGLKAGEKPIPVKLPARTQRVSYAKEIAEILEDRCTGCHGPALAENKLSLEDVPAMLRGGKRGPALVPGKADSSLLFRMAAHQVEPAMPPKDKPGNAPLTPEELGLLKLWIDAGARDDSAAEPDAAKARHARPVVLGELPPGVEPINAVDLTAGGARVAAGRGNTVRVHDIDSGLEIVKLGGHKDLIESLRFSPDGRLLAAGSYQIVTLWTVPSGGPLKTLSGHAGPVQALAVTADGALAFSGGEDRTLRGWNLAQATQDWSLTLPSAVTALALTADQKAVLAGAADGTIRLIELADRRERAALKGHAGAVVGLAALRSGGKAMRFASASLDGTARMWTVTTAAKTDPIVLRGHKGAVQALAVSAPSDLVATAGEDATVRLWSGRDGGAKGTIVPGHSGAIHALAFGPDGAALASGGADGTVRLSTVGKEAPGRVLRGFAGAVHDLAFSPRGDRLAAAGAEGGIKVWDTASWQGVIAFGHTPARGDGALPPARKVAFAAEGRLVSASADATLRTWEFAGSWAGRGVLAPHADRVLALDFSPDGKLLAAGGGEPSRSGELKVWDVARGVPVRSLDALHSDTVCALRFSPDGTRLASAAADRFLKVTRAGDGKQLRSFEGHTGHVLAVDWRADGKQLISGGADKVLKLWEFESGEQVRTLQEAGKPITAARWIAGKPEVAAASGDGLVRVWNTESDGVARAFAGPTDYVSCVAATADGSRIAGGGADRVLYVWDGRSGRLLRRLAPPPRDVAR
jgi:WD40 repeat protein